MTAATQTAPSAGPARRFRMAVKGALFRYSGLRGYILFSPTLLVLVGAMCLPVGILVLYSFWTQKYLEIDHTLTIANYVAILQRASYMLLIGKSILISLAVTMTTVLLAYPIAYFVAFRVTQHKIIWLILITVPFWTSYLLRVFSWKVILGYNGVVNSSLLTLGIIDEPLTFILYNVNAVVITLAHAYAPFAILPIFVALEKIDRTLLEASQDLGESKLLSFWRVTLPLSVPGVVAAVLIVFIPTIGDYVTPQLVGGPEGRMIANVIQLQYLRLDNYPLGSALAASAMLIVTAVSLVFLFLNRRFLRVRQ